MKRLSLLPAALVLGAGIALLLSIMRHSATQAAAVSALAGYDFRADDVRQVELPNRLREVSGLALDARGRVFAHDDERAIVYRLDVDDGDVGAAFEVGRNGRRGDFEGITFAGSRIFLITSRGDLLEFEEGDDGETVAYSELPAPSRRNCSDIEGLDYDAPGNALLIACKAPSGRALRGRLVILRFSLRSRTLDEQPFVATPLAALEMYGLEPRLSPSGIAVHPVTGTILVLAARERAIVEIDRGGTILAAAELRGKHHNQPEGIAVMRDGTLLIADEGGSDDATLTSYAYRPGVMGR